VPIVQQLQRDVATLSQTAQDQSATIADLQAALSAQSATLSNVQSDVSAHGNQLLFVTVDGTEMYITGANLNIRDGSGQTVIPKPAGGVLPTTSGPSRTDLVTSSSGTTIRTELFCGRDRPIS